MLTRLPQQVLSQSIWCGENLGLNQAVMLLVIDSIRLDICYRVARGLDTDYVVHQQ
jgi:hypothetical protein